MEVLKTRMWAVRYTLPAINGDMGERRYAKNVNVTCICESFEEALAMTRERAPDAIVWSVVHKGGDEFYYRVPGHEVLVKR